MRGFFSSFFSFPAFLLLLAAIVGVLVPDVRGGDVPEEQDLLLLRQGGRVAGFLPQGGAHLVVFRLEDGANVLDARPERWKAPPAADLLGETWQQYYGESTWAGPQADWWTTREPHPPALSGREKIWPGAWPPDPAWEMAPYEIVERTASRAVLRSPVSKLTGLQLTKTVELRADGTLSLRMAARNCGDRAVTRDLWFLLRVRPEARCFVPFRQQGVEKDLARIATLKKIGGLAVLERIPGFSPRGLVEGKLVGIPEAGWMAATLPGSGVFLVVRFPLADPVRIAPGQSPVEVFFATAPNLLSEIEHHGEIVTLQPGEIMERETLLQLVPKPEDPSESVKAEARFLRTRLSR